MADLANYCSWIVEDFCITQSEWAAWTQAGGSTLALAIAIVVPLVLHLREQSAQRHQLDRNQIERERLERINAKAAAATILPVARAFLGALHSSMSQLTDADIECYNDIADEQLIEKLDLFRGCSHQLAAMRDAGEPALDAIASAELFLRSLADWQFFERYTENGVIEDTERGYREIFDKPPQLLPIARLATSRINLFLERADAMFDQTTHAVFVTT
ncbi:hypothetical protein [Stenotrophomonas sp.]|uniref:hypothetical protein n=1 Tax=Stenotrophomonas sp. TaxID=69392 RepID=UPI0028AA2C8C|nr:hypothetical protein [Stenotrophomonas sp.]